jgi:hypothetical protein
MGNDGRDQRDGESKVSEFLYLKGNGRDQKRQYSQCLGCGKLGLKIFWQMQMLKSSFRVNGMVEQGEAKDAVHHDEDDNAGGDTVNISILFHSLYT